MAENEVKTLTMTVERGKIAEFARAIRDDNPIYFDEKKARAAGFAGIPAPPTFFEVWLRYLNFALAEDRPRARPREGTTRAAGFDGGREVEYFKPVLAGDTLTMTQRDAGSYQREGRRGGQLTFRVMECVFTNQRGEKVLVVRSTGVSTSQVPGEQ